MSEFKPIADGFFAAGQIDAADIVRAKEAGIVAVVNNRPDGEVPDQPAGDTIRKAVDGVQRVAEAGHLGPGPTPHRSEGKWFVR